MSDQEAAPEAFCTACGWQGPLDPRWEYDPELIQASCPACGEYPLWVDASSTSPRGQGRGPMTDSEDGARPPIIRMEVRWEGTYAELQRAPWQVTHGGPSQVEVRMDADGRAQVWQDGHPLGTPSAPLDPTQPVRLSVTLRGPADIILQG